MKKFELLIVGNVGVGFTACNKAVREHGDYKTIAHISDMGHIKFYCRQAYIPNDAIERIQSLANELKSEWEEIFNNMKLKDQYFFLLDKMPFSEYMKISKMKDKTWEEKIEYMKPILFENHLS